MACLSRLAVASVNTHRTRWPTPTPTQTRSYIHLCTQMYNPQRYPLPARSVPLPTSPDGVAFLLPPRLLSTLPGLSPATRLHGHRTSSLLSRWPGTYLALPPESEFCKSRALGTLAILTIIISTRRGKGGKIRERKSIALRLARLIARGTRLQSLFRPFFLPCFSWSREISKRFSVYRR